MVGALTRLLIRCQHRSYVLGSGIGRGLEGSMCAPPPQKKMFWDQVFICCCFFYLFCYWCFAFLLLQQFWQGFFLLQCAPQILCACYAPVVRCHQVIGKMFFFFGTRISISIGCWYGLLVSGVVRLFGKHVHHWCAYHWQWDYYCRLCHLHYLNHTRGEQNISY